MLFKIDLIQKREEKMKGMLSRYISTSTTSERYEECPPKDRGRV